jgi:phosphonate transport system substrate-binding protein
LRLVGIEHVHLFVLARVRNFRFVVTRVLGHVRVMRRFCASVNSTRFVEVTSASGRVHSRAVQDVTFGVVSRAPETLGALGNFCRRLRVTTGIALAPAVYGSYADLLARTIDGRVDVVWAPPLIAIELEDRGVASPAVVVRRSSRVGYYSALFCLADARWERVEDLSRARAAWVSKESASGYVVPRWHLRSLGVRLNEAFADEEFFASHEAMTQAVLDGRADVGATHVSLDPVTGKLAAAPWLALGAAPGAVRVLLLVGPIPGDVVAVSSRLDSSAKRRLVAALVALRDDADGLALFEASAFEPVPDGHLTLLRRLARFNETRA